MGTKAATTGRKRKGPSLQPIAGRKHRRTPAAPEVQAGGWASLPTDITLLVAGRVLDGDVVDYISFRAVCSGWRACTASPRDPTMLDPRLRPRAWVALCNGDGDRPDETGEIAFFHTRIARSLRVRPPELRRYRIISFTDGLVILLHKRTTAVRVLHPFTGVAVDLPPLAPLYNRVVRHRGALLEMNAAVCTATTSAISIAVVVWFPYIRVVLSAEPGSQGWEVIHRDMNLQTFLPFQGRLYGFLLPSRQIVQVYPASRPGLVVNHTRQSILCYPKLCGYYLVESGQSMLLVIQHRCVNKPEGMDQPWQCFLFEIFEVDVSSGSWGLSRVRSLGDRALFLYKERCLSVSSKDLPSIRSNSIYFFSESHNCIILHSLGDRLFEQPTELCKVHDKKEMIRPSVRPFTVADHLLTYCSHREWARGLMFHEFRVIPECFDDLHKKIRKQDSRLVIPRTPKGQTYLEKA